ncbi:MAG: hypothetical protein O2887_07975 [Bacteroidetes bacterium]|nr:hypothetical protein [Bacteroidota bacterium]MDA1120416.1 hypothetical protein [Bacteroidota bacterium]
MALITPVKIKPFDQRDKEKLIPVSHWNVDKMITFPGKILCFIEFRHIQKFSIEIKASPMIAID